MFCKWIVCRYIYLKKVLSNFLAVVDIVIVCTQLYGFKYFYVIPIIQFLYTVKWFQVFLCNTNNSIFVHS